MPESSHPNNSRAIAKRRDLLHAFEQNLRIDVLTAELMNRDINILNGEPGPESIKPGEICVLTAQGLPGTHDSEKKGELKKQTLTATLQEAYEQLKTSNDKSLLNIFKPHPETIFLLPLEYNSHWYLVEINLTPTKINSVSVWDPRKKQGTLPPYAQLANIIHEATGIKSPQIQTSTVAGRQTENYSCGDWIADEIERRKATNTVYQETTAEFLRLIHVSKIFHQRLREIKSGIGSNHDKFETNVVMLISNHNLDIEQTKQKIRMLVDRECLTKSNEVLNRILQYLANKSLKLSESSFVKQVLQPKSVIEWAYAKNFFTATEIFKGLPHKYHEAALDILKQRLQNSEDKNALYILKQELGKLESASNILEQRFKNFKNDLREYFAYEITQEGSPLNLALIEELTKPSISTVDVEAEIAELEAKIEVNEQDEQEQPLSKLERLSRLVTTPQISDEEVEAELDDLAQKIATKNKSSTSTTTITPDSSVSQTSGFEEELGETATQPATKNAATIEQPIEQTESLPATQVVDNLTVEQEKPLLGSDTTTKDSNEKTKSTHEKKPPVSNNRLKKWFNSWFRSNSNYQELEPPEPMSPITAPESTGSTIIIPTPVVQQIAEPSPLSPQTTKNTAIVEQPTQQEVLPLQASDSVQMPTSSIIGQESVQQSLPEPTTTDSSILDLSPIFNESQSNQEITKNSPGVLSDCDEDSLTEDESEGYLSPSLFRQQLLQAYDAKKYPPNTDAKILDETREDLQDFSSDDKEDSLIEKPNSPPQPFSEAGTLVLIAAARLITLRAELNQLTTVVNNSDKIEVTLKLSKKGLNERTKLIDNQIAKFKIELDNEIHSLTPFLSADIINQSQVQRRIAEFEQLTKAATQLETQLNLSKEHHLRTLQGLINTFANDVNQIGIEINRLDLEINGFISEQIIVNSPLENNTAELEAQGNGLLDKLAQQEQAINAQLELSQDFADTEIEASKTKLKNLIPDVANLKAQLIIKIDLTRIQAELVHLRNDFAKLLPITSASLKQDYDKFLAKPQALAAKIPNPLPDSLTDNQRQAYQELTQEIGRLTTDVNASKNAIDQLFQQRKDSYNNLRKRTLSLRHNINKFITAKVDPNRLVRLNEQAKNLQNQLEILRQQVEQDIAELASFADPSFAAEKTKGTELLKRLRTIFAIFSREVTKKQTTLLVAGLPLDFMRAQLTEPTSYLKWYNSLGIVNLVQRTIEATRKLIPAEQIKEFEAAVRKFNTQHKLDTLQSFFKVHLTSSALYKTYLDQINDSIPLAERANFNQAIKAFYKSGETNGLAVFLENHLRLEIRFKRYLTMLNNLTAQDKIQFNRAVLSAQKGNYQLLSEFFMDNPRVKNLFSRHQDFLKWVEPMWQSQRQENYKEKMQLEPQNEPRVSSYHRAHHYLGKLFDNITEEQKKLEEAAEMRGDNSASQERNAIIENIFAAYQNETIDDELDHIEAKSSREYEEESARDKPKATTIRGLSSS